MSVHKIHAIHSESKDIIKKFYRSNFFQRLFNCENSIAERDGRTYRLFTFGPKVGGWKLVGSIEHDNISKIFAIVIGYTDEVVEMVTDESSGFTIPGCYEDIYALADVTGSALPFAAALCSPASQEKELMQDIQRFLNENQFINNIIRDGTPYTHAVLEGGLVFSRLRIGDYEYISIRTYDKSLNPCAYIWFGDGCLASVDIIGDRANVAYLRKFFVIPDLETKSGGEEVQPEQDNETLALHKLLQQFEGTHLWKMLVDGRTGAFNSELGFDVIRRKEQETAEDDLVLDFYQAQPDHQIYKIVTVSWRKNGEVSAVYHVNDDINPKQAMVTIMEEMIAYPNHKKQQSDNRQPTVETQWNAIIDRFKKTTLFRTMFNTDAASEQRFFLDYQLDMIKSNPGDQHMAFFMEVRYKGQLAAKLKFLYNGDDLTETYSHHVPGFDLPAVIKMLDYLVETEETRDRNGETWGPLPALQNKFGVQIHQAEEPVFVNLSTGDLNDDWVCWYVAKNSCSISRAVCVGMHRLENLAISINMNLTSLKEVE